ncbi:MAG: TonB-dependent receptor [Verrucomicrobia bacterium]|nr:TonB-dependent receptor [Verrucomicrobiota bacterium]
MLRRLSPIGLALLIAFARAQTAPESPVKLAEFVVTPSQFGVADQRSASLASLTSTELDTLPQVGDDLFRSIARLPGLSAADFTASFWVRGAPNSQVLARLDGAQLIEPFHLKDVDGALSIIDPRSISRLDLITGGFGADYGDRQAGVLTLDTRTPTRKRTGLELSLTGVGAHSEGVFAANRGRWLVSARRGYPDIALRVAHRDDEVSPRYYDAFAKVEYEPAAGHTLSFHVLHAGDTFRYHRKNNPDLVSDYDSDYAWARWRGAAGPQLNGEAVLAFTRLTWGRNGAGTMDGYPFFLRDHRSLRQVSLRNDWSLTLGERALVRSGFEAATGSARYNYGFSHQFNSVSAGRQIVVTDTRSVAPNPDGDTLGAFVAARVQPLGALVLEPGLRFDRHTASRDRDVSPRFNAALPLGRATLRAAWGLYFQSQGLHELAANAGDTRFYRSEQAEHRVLSVETPLARGLGLRVEAYERLMTHVRPRWENLDNAYDLFPEAQDDRVRLNPSRGRARGVEFLLTGRAASRLTWNATYALARAEELLVGRWTPRARDQRHTFYVDTTYTPSPRWQFSAAWQYHSGNPTTDVAYSLATLTNGRRVLVSANDPIYGLRLPGYHRLDARLTRKITLARGELRLFLDVFNAYDRDNLVGYDHNVVVSGTTVTDTRKPRKQLPLLPSVGGSWEF